MDIVNIHYKDLAVLQAEAEEGEGIHQYVGAWLPSRDVLSKQLMAFATPGCCSSSSGAGLGFTGKQIIHPAQIEVVQNAYSPSAEALARSVKIVAAHYKHLAEVRGHAER